MVEAGGRDSLVSGHPRMKGAVARADAVGVIRLHKQLGPHLVVQAADTPASAEAAARVDGGKRRVVNLLNLNPLAESQDEKRQHYKEDDHKRND